VDAALDLGERGRATLGLVGITIGCSVADRALDEPLFQLLFAEQDRHGSVVFLHSVGSGVLEGDAILPLPLGSV
jgi:hypothetical protein